MPLLPNLEPSLALVGLGAARTVPLVLSIPVFGGPALPLSLRLALGAGLALLCFPLLATATPPTDAAVWVWVAGREVLVGAVMGLVVACMFRAAEAAGEITDRVRGSYPDEASSPITRQGSSPLGSLLLLLASVIFFEMGGVGRVVNALGRSYEAIPVGTPVEIAARAQSAAILVIVATGKLIEAAIALAAPALVALLLADLVLGVIGRAVSGLAVHSAATSARALLALGAVLLALGGIEAAIQGGFRGCFALLEAALRGGQ